MPYSKYNNTLSSPAREIFAITPNDTTPLAKQPKALKFNVGGTVVIRAVDSTADVTITVLAGEILPVIVSYVKATGTTATGIHGLL